MKKDDATEGLADIPNSNRSSDRFVLNFLEGALSSIEVHYGVIQIYSVRVSGR